MTFEIVGAIENVETIASGTGVKSGQAPENSWSRTLAEAEGHRHGSAERQASAR
ncbi:MAG: hypothetical protein R2712_19545 [Vicinamibacterales bacterium]